MKKFDFVNKWPFHLGLILFSIVADQLTKLFNDHIASNEKIPEDCWYTAGRNEEGIEKSFAHP